MAVTTSHAATATPPTAAVGIRRVRRQRTATPWLFMAPFLTFFATFVVVPAGFGVWVSLHNWDYVRPGPQPFVGLENYLRLFTPGSRDFADFWQSMGATALFTVISVPFLVAIPLAVAVVLNRRFPGRAVARAAIFAPYVLGIAVVGVVWRFMLDPQFGVVNRVAAALGLPADTPWLQVQPWAWVSLVVATVWWTIGFNTIIYLAGLQSIPREHYEAAALDGAGALARFRHITIPGLGAVLAFVVTLTILASANMFGQSYIITMGGPGNSTRTAIMYIAETGINGFRMGPAAAMSYFLAALLIVIAIGNFRLLRRSTS